jgi:hypothetical protein
VTKDEYKALRQIVNKGDDKNLVARKWKPVKVALYKMGYLKRRVGDWAWVPTTEGINAI